MPAVVLADVELVVSGHLSDVLAGDAHVCTVYPEDGAGDLPVVRVVRRGGTWLHRKVLDDATVDVDIWHADLAALNGLTARVRAEVEDMQGRSFPGAFITRTSEVVGPQRLPEDDPQLLRAGFTVGLLVRPLPG